MESVRTVGYSRHGAKRDIALIFYSSITIQRKKVIIIHSPYCIYNQGDHTLHKGTCGDDSDAPFAHDVSVL